MSNIRKYLITAINRTIIPILGILVLSGSYALQTYFPIIPMCVYKIIVSFIVTFIVVIIGTCIWLSCTDKTAEQDMDVDSKDTKSIDKTYTGKVYGSDD